MARLKGRAFNFNVKFKTTFTSKGRTAQNANTVIQNAARAEEGRAQRALQRSAAFARGVIRRGMRRGRNTMKGAGKKDKRGRFMGNPRRQRHPSKPGSPPNVHAKGNSFGLRWIRFNRVDRNTFIVGPEYRRTKGSWRSKFYIDRMMEEGGSGRILAPNKLNATDQGWATWRKIKKNGERWPSTFVAARYPARPYTSIAIEPVRREFPQIYVRSK